MSIQRLRVVRAKSIPRPVDVHAHACNHVEFRDGNIWVAHPSQEEVVLLFLALLLGHHVGPGHLVLGDVTDLPCPLR